MRTFLIGSSKENLKISKKKFSFKVAKNESSNLA